MVDRQTGLQITKNGACDYCHARTWVTELTGKQGGEVCDRSTIRVQPAECPLRKGQQNAEVSRLVTNLSSKLKSLRQ